MIAHAEAAAMTILWTLVVVFMVLGALWWSMRRTPAPVARDTELPTTEPADPDSPPDTVPGSVVWLRNEWRNTIPTGADASG